MLSKSDILLYLKENKDHLFSNFQLTKLGLFGSFARDEASKESDIDLLVEFQPKTKNLSQKKAELKKVVGKEFQREVDICREKYIKPYFKSQILKSAIYV